MHEDWIAVRDLDDEVSYDDGVTSIVVGENFAGIRTLENVERGMHLSVVPAQGPDHGTFAGWPDQDVLVRIADDTVDIMVGQQVLASMPFAYETLSRITWLGGTLIVCLDGSPQMRARVGGAGASPFEIFAGGDGEGVATVNHAETSEMQIYEGPCEPWEGPRDNFGLRAPARWVSTQFGGRRRGR